MSGTPARKAAAERSAELDLIIHRLEEGLEKARWGQTSPGLHTIASAVQDLKVFASGATQ